MNEGINSSDDKCKNNFEQLLLYTNLQYSRNFCFSVDLIKGYKIFKDGIFVLLEKFSNLWIT